MHRIKAFFIEVYYFLTSRVFWIYFGAILAATAVLVLFLFWLLRSYTLHGESVAVPDVKGKSLVDAQKLLEPRGLRYVVSDSLYDKELKPGTILDQIPLPNAKVKESRTIYLVVNRSVAPSVPISYSDLIGRPLKEVERRLTALGLVVGKKEYTEGRAQNTVAMARIGRQILFREADPSRGEKRPTQPQKVPQGTVIDLVLYKGNDAEAKEVPDLVCKTFGKAEGIIKMNKFLVGQIHLDAGITDTLKAYVRQQDPPSYMLTPMGSGISLWLTPNKPKACEDEGY